MKRTLLTAIAILTSSAFILYAHQVESRALADNRPTSPSVSLLSAAKERPRPTAQEMIRKRVTVYVPQTREIIGVASEAEGRAKEYSDLMLQKAQRMTEEELDEAIKTVQNELEAENAAAETELQHVIEHLEQIVKASPGTPAANRAQQALFVLSNDRPTAETYSPAPVTGEFNLIEQ